MSEQPSTFGVNFRTWDCCKRLTSTVRLLKLRWTMIGKNLTFKSQSQSCLMFRTIALARVGGFHSALQETRRSGALPHWLSCIHYRL